MNHLSSHIKQLAKYLGVYPFYEIGSEYQEFSDGRHALLVEKVKQDIISLVNQIG